MSESGLQFNYNGFEIDNTSTRLELSIVNGDEISTVKIESAEHPEDQRAYWETCVFYESSDVEADSEVLARYTSEAEARAGHRNIVDEFVRKQK